MGQLGKYLIMFGAASAVLSLFDYELTLLMWIETWGEGVAWLIRGALILVGMGLVSSEMKGQPQPQQAPLAQETNPPSVEDMIR